MPLTQVNPGLLDTQAQYTGFKNRIINGSMMIDQRNAGASVTANNSYAVDRWIFEITQTSKFTGQQNAGSVTPPAGFVNYLGITSSSAYTVISSDFFLVSQFIEGFNTADLAWGTANAATVTLSFWVRSSLTGTFGGCLENNDGSRSYVFSYTINSANTWEQKTITIAGDTTGTWVTNNLRGIACRFSFGTGSNWTKAAGSWGATRAFGVIGGTSVVGTNGATFYITGVQLEKGSTATSFDYRPYGTELQLCYRYCEAYNADSSTNYTYFSIGQVMSSVNTRQTFNFKGQKRALPTVTTSAANTFLLDLSPSSATVTGLSLDRTTVNGCTLNADVASSSMSAQQSVRMIQNTLATSFIIFSAEL